MIEMQQFSSIVYFNYSQLQYFSSHSDERARRLEQSCRDFCQQFMKISRFYAK